MRADFIRSNVLCCREVTLIEKTYGHLLNTRDRSPVVAYRETQVIKLRKKEAQSA